MTLQAAHWLLLAPLMFIMWWRFAPRGILSPLRIMTVLLLVVALSDPSILSRYAARTVWLIVDKSASAAQGLAPNINEWETIVARSMPSGDSLRILEFSAGVYERLPGRPSSFEGSAEESRIGLALQYVLDHHDDAHSHRVLMLSDGYATDSLSKVGGELLRAGVPVDYRSPAGRGGGDFFIERLDIAPRVRSGEQFLIELVVRGTENTVLPYEIYRDGKLLKRSTIDLRNGIGMVRLSDRLDQTGASRYEAVILPPQDSRLGNNRAQRWTEASGSKHILVVSQSAKSIVFKWWR